MVKQIIEVFTCEKCGRIGECHFYEHQSNEGKFCRGKVVPVVYLPRNELRKAVEKSVFIEHLTEEQQRELWSCLGFEVKKNDH
jgi:hypothetical protein